MVWYVVVNDLGMFYSVFSYSNEIVDSIWLYQGQLWSARSGYTRKFAIYF